MIALSLFIKNIFGWITLHWRIVAGAVGVFLLLLVFGLVYHSCSKPKATVDLDTVNKINSGNKAEVRKEVREMVEENAQVTTTVDNRTTIAETNVIERDRFLDEKVRVIEKKIADAHAVGRDVTQQELECELVPSSCQ